jgi:hypothetical protein
MIVSEKGKNGARFQSHIPHFVNFIQVFNSFNLCEITRHSDWSPGLIPRTGPKKLKIFQLFIIRLAKSPDQSEPKISTDGACADFVLFLSGPIRCLFSGVEISL